MLLAGGGHKTIIDEIISCGAKQKSLVWLIDGRRYKYHEIYRLYIVSPNSIKCIQHEGQSDILECVSASARFNGQLATDVIPRSRMRKVTSCGQHKDFIWSKCEMQGWRDDMEDSFTTSIHLPKPLEGFYQIKKNCKKMFLEWSFFAVFDGHGGPQTAWKCSDRILAVILNRPEIQDLTDSINYDPERIGNAIAEAFYELDIELKNEEGRYFYNGSTCTAVMITPKHMFVSNLGDSRTIIIKQIPAEEPRRKTGPTRRKRNSIKFSTSDHK